MSLSNQRLAPLYALTLGTLLVAGCGGGSGSSADAAATGATATADTSTATDATATDTSSDALRTRRTTTTTTTATTSGTTSGTTTSTSSSTATWTQCAEENGTCTFSGTRTVKYGTTSAYVTRVLTTSTPCDNATFGDPAVGAWKYCWVGDTASADTTAATTTTATTTAAPSTTTTTAATTTTTATATAAAPAGVQWTGMTAAMWAEVTAQRASFGDANDCLARVNAIPTSGGVTLSPGGDINAALASNSVVFLNAGTYKLTSRTTVPQGKKLVGVAGASVTLDATGAPDYGIVLNSNAVLANVVIEGAPADGVLFSQNGNGSSNSLVYQVSSRHSGYYAASSGSSGIRVTANASNNCVVSSEATQTWNSDGGSNANGGNSDGVNNSFGAYNNTFIDVHSFNNGDDGFDMWQGGQSYWYFSNAHDNGKVTGRTNGGDGNGIKLGTGSVAHKFYKTTATSNRTGGFNLNGNTVQPVLVQSTASSNGTGDYINGVLAP